MRANWCFYGFLLLLTMTVRPCNGAESIEFNRDIRPILAETCFQCHGPDESSREAGLRLDSPDAEDGPFHSVDGEQAIKPGDVAASKIWQRLTTDDPDAVMPPHDSHKEPLSPEQLELIRQWISEGAQYDAFWAFVPPKPRVAPTVNTAQWNHNRIDQFVMSRLETKGHEPQPRADRRTLIRRVSFDLTGLPPTREEIRRFLDDQSPDAFEHLVDRLIGSPHYGEHMAKYWLDLVRFADTNGIHHDHYREMTPYRDWVIRAFNGNFPFDQFIVDQLAGDLHANPTLDQQIASGFNRLHLVIDKGTAIPEESFARNVIDRVTAVGTAFMGLTVGCAVCHDHKYDPVTQKDFFQLYAFFNNIDSGPETPGRGVHAPFVRLPNAEQETQLLQLDQQLAAATEQVDRLKAAQQANEEAAKKADATLEENANSETEAGQGGDAAELAAATETLKSLQKAKRKLEEVIPVSLVMKEREEVRPTHILIRGAYDQPGEEVFRNTPTFLPPLQAEGEVKTRMDLAKWFVDPSHPLTARVTVNRFWQQFFGVGLVKTSEDFGTQGDWPSHPDLLDDLTNTFVQSGWDVKALVKSIVLSETYQQASTATAAAFKTDPANRLLARGSRFRLDAEMIRDQILSVSGLLNASMFGKSVKPPQPPNLWKTVSMVSSSTYAFEADTGEKIYRRSLYSFWKRALPPPQMTIFDAPTREACTARRERTNTPLQALVLMNETQYFKAAKHFAERLLLEADEDRQRIQIAYESITSHLPDDSELDSLLDGLNVLRTTYRDNVSLAREMITTESISDSECVDHAAYSMLVNALLNLDVTKTRE